MPTNATPGRLSGCYVISLRPVGGHDAIRRAAARHGARTLALSPWRIETHGDRTTRAALRAALAAPRVLFTSPAAVAAAVRLRALRVGRGQVFVAVGAGTALALRRAGVAAVDAPQRMDSEGLLALPSLGSVRGLDIGLVTAPGGRGVIATTLAGRGARVLRANVYARVPIAPPPRAVAALRALDAPAWLLASSGEALEHIVARLPDDALAVLRRAHVVAASERLATLARGLGLRVAAVASSARPAAMLDAACAGAAAKP
ncbi:uroporphyrinogen-III synthase [Luteimonas sp. MC1572]|uniref:uroporphyrinogen-III synthase n=1 Tax=Luteimonas sp. MC1572 TaxID=2799325 RepID=UPI0018F0C855|nr:uroporphyrinogen-III synthase [Luteimonas sp. MC1572]MBJ6982065.1 uroporphyrinogen-III synthase [Luteimonas sp. MC1572]QQO03362.1 uroporphyrinogen-III synthase [Luteimonas sp. MC1572]